MSDLIQQLRVSLLRAVARKFPGRPHPELGAAIQSQPDPEELLRWYEEVAVTASLEAVHDVILGSGRPPRPAPGVREGWLTRAFFDNQKAFPTEQLDAYAGQHIAWSWDGSRILASASDEAELRRKLVAAGHDPFQVVYDYVDDGRTSHAG
jgi:hypothetical protein